MVYPSFHTMKNLVLPRLLSNTRRQYGSRWKCPHDGSDNQAHIMEHKLIRKRKGNVEKSHSKDKELLYATHTFYSFEDYGRQLTGL